MLVPKAQFERVIEAICAYSTLSVDTETTGLHPHLGDRLFSVIVGTLDQQWYFNFQPYENYEDFVLPREWIARLQPIFDGPRTLYLHNAKFDMHFLAKEGISVHATVHDTMVFARLLHNDYLSYSLSACAERIGLKKSEIVDEYIKKEKLYVKEKAEGRKAGRTKKFFDQVPPKVIVPYGLQDAKITYALGAYQEERLSDGPKIQSLKDLERETTAVVFGMERAGIQIDKEYCARGFEDARRTYQDAAKEFEKLCGTPFVDSNKSLARAFEGSSERMAFTEKGNPSFVSDVLETFSSPLAKLVLRHRYAHKVAHTYFQNFLELCDESGRLHADFRQSQTSTGRFAMADPNLQNVPKELPEGGFDLRRCFVPSPGFVFLEFDYEAMEFRLMLDYAGETELIDAIKRGLDPHQATADLTGLTRKLAKTLNFGLLYGMGVGKLAQALNTTEEQARAFKYQYFERLPGVRTFINQATQTAKVRGNVFNWAGRTYQFPDPNFAYKAANAIIQGGCADIVRKAMVEVARQIPNFGARLLLQVHDSLLLEVPKDAAPLVVPLVKRVMEEAYTPRSLPMSVKAEVGEESWGSLRPYEETRDEIQGTARVARLEETAQCMV